MLVKGVLAQGDLSGSTLADKLAEAIEDQQFDRLDVAVAYATEAGLTALHNSIGGWPAVTRWVVGLDDAITQPKAIDTLLALAGASVRLARLGPKRRFHPKLYCFWSSTDSSTAVCIVGSANMTDHGLKLNGEAAVILEAQSQADAEQLKDSWLALNSLGQDASTFDLQAYRALHARASKARRRLQKSGFLPAQPEADEIAMPAFNGAPEFAAVAWLDAGSATAQGREVEFPRAMMPYFGVSSSTPSPQQLRLRQATRTDVLPLTMREDNAMWRIGFTQAAIHAGTGRNSLRPLAGGNRSDLAIAVTRRGNHQYDLEFVPLGSQRYSELIANSTAAGALHRTRQTPDGRNFGFY